MTTVPLADARANLSRFVDSAVRTHERITVTRNGVPAAVLLSADDYDAMVETLDILSDPHELAAIRDGEADIDAGRSVSLEEMRAEMIRLGRIAP